MTTANPLRRFDRAAAVDRLGSEEFDVLVVGGGITGAGVALDAAVRGLKVAIVERDDWASGTSSKSSKLVHGGLRYLQQKEYRLVYENLAERQRLLDNAPHLVKPLPFLIPLFGKDGLVKASVAKAYSTALWLYDVTGGLRIGKRHRRIDVDEALRHLPTLNRDLLVAAFVYYDARADDARLTLTLVRTAALDHGAVAVNHCAVTGLTRDAAGQVDGATLADGTVVRARSVVNAAGVWADDVQRMDDPADEPSIRPAKGVHVTVPRHRLPCDIAAVLPVPKDRRSIFVIPWGDLVYLGTTDTDYDGPLESPRCTAEDVDYVLGAANLFVTGEKLTPADVVGTWAGLRPLLRSGKSDRTADLSRRHAVTVSPSGVISVTGGKLTTYRKMAQDTVDVVVSRAGRRMGHRGETKRLKLRGAAGWRDVTTPGALSHLGLSSATLEHLADRYGGEARAVLALVEQDASLAEPLVPGLPYLRAEAVWAVREEMATTLEDVLSRRTRALLLARDATAAVAEDVAALVAAELGWSAEEAAAQVGAFRELVAAERDAASVPSASGGAA